MSFKAQIFQHDNLIIYTSQENAFHYRMPCSTSVQLNSNLFRCTKMYLNITLSVEVCTFSRHSMAFNEYVSMATIAQSLNLHLHIICNGLQCIHLYNHTASITSSY